MKAFAGPDARHRLLRSALCAPAALLLGRDVAAQAPGPVTIVVPATPGTSQHVLARLLAPFLQRRLGQTVIGENRPDASGNIGTQLVRGRAIRGLALRDPAGRHPHPMTTSPNEATGIARVCGLGHLTLETPDLPRKLDHFMHVVGLSVMTHGRDAAWLAGPDGQPALVLRAGAALRPARLSLRLGADAAPAEVLRDLRNRGLRAMRRHDTGPGLPEAVAFVDPNGPEVELHLGHAPAAAPVRPEGGVVPEKLGHVDLLRAGPAG